MYICDCTLSVHCVLIVTNNSLQFVLRNINVALINIACAVYIAALCRVFYF